MKNSVVFFFMALILLGLIPAVAAEKKGDAKIESIDFTEKDGIELVRVRLTERTIPKIFELDGEHPRVVCDFPETAYNAGNRRIIAAGGKLVKRIRIGLHHAPVVKTRVVLDLEENVQYSVDQVFEEEGNVLIIRISPKPAGQQGSEPAPSPEKETGRGNKGPATPPPATEAEGDEQDSTGVLEQKKVDPEASGPDVSVSQGIEVFQEDAESYDSGEKEADAEDEGMGFAALYDISFEVSTDDKEMVLFRLSGFYPPVVFSTEEDDLLVVCDFFDAVLAIGIDPVMETGGKYIKEVSVTTHQDPDKVRVILELADSYNYDLKQVFFREDNLFVLIISSLGENGRQNMLPQG